MYNIMERLAALRRTGKKYYAADVIRVLKDKRISVTTADFSRYVNGVYNPPKSELVLSEADKIVSEWEQK